MHGKGIIGNVSTSNECNGPKTPPKYTQNSPQNVQKHLENPETVLFLCFEKKTNQLNLLFTSSFEITK